VRQISIGIVSSRDVAQQVATGFLIELGNGDKFVFDLGSGAFLNLFATGVSPAKLDKVM
jgi:ribonuclease Z